MRIELVAVKGSGQLGYDNQNRTKLLRDRIQIELIGRFRSRDLLIHLAAQSGNRKRNSLHHHVDSPGQCVRNTYSFRRARLA